MTAAPVVVVGEALMDLAVAREGTLRPLPGGGPFNAARALGRLGQPTVFLGALSRDAFGQRLAAVLKADGVTFDERLLTDRPTSLAMAEIDAAGTARYRFYFDGTSAESLDPQVALPVLPRRPAALVVGGLGLVLEPLADAMEAILGRLSGVVPVLVDPNVRPALIPDPEAYAARLARVIAAADIVKLSDDDVKELAPDRTPDDYARELLGQGPKLVLLTRGVRGATVFGAFGAAAAAAPKVTVVDTIGAGDTFSGAWLAHWLAGGRPLQDGEAVRKATVFACCAAALSCARAGASPPTVDQVRRAIRLATDKGRGPDGVDPVVSGRVLSDLEH